MRRTGKNKLSSAERRLFLLLGVPSLGLSVCLTVLATYLPVLASRFTSSRTVIGALVGGEGFVGLLVPLWVGAWSDRVNTPIGRRLPFLLVTAPVAALALSLVPFARSIPVMALGVFFFYLAYFTYYAPYRALYADLVSREATARAQGIQGVFIEAGLGCALVGGGLLLEVWRPLPYVVAAASLLVGTAVLARGLLRRKAERGAPAKTSASSPPGEVWALIHDHRCVRNFAMANALLALAFGGLKTFVVLWLTVGLGKTMTFTSAVMAVVAAGTVMGALAAGKLADDYGVARVMGIALSVFSVGAVLPVFSNSTLVLGAALPLIALCGGAAAVLPYALLLHLMPPGSHGAGAALYDVSGGIGTLLGPAITGAAIDLLHPLFPSTQGYAAIWPVIGVSTLLCILALWRTAPEAGGAPPREPSSVDAARPGGATSHMGAGEQGD
jgi:MFS family permease